jgi:tetratricopeptide (TPR) repeat protein
MNPMDDPPVRRLTENVIIREPLLITILVVLASIFFVLTHSYTQAYDRRREELGTLWLNRGNVDLQQNQPAAAVDAFRTALVYAPHQWEYRLRLAEALTAANRINEAIAYYRSLRQNRPDSGIVNLELARLISRTGDGEEVQKLYNGAIFGEWAANASENRREAFFELIDYFLKRNDTAQAESQLIALSANLPADAQVHRRVADLFLQVGDNQRALEQYGRALREKPKDADMLLGVGKAAFRSAQYAVAKSYLERAVREQPQKEEAKTLLEASQWILTSNPLAPDIPISEKTRRIMRSFSQAGQRLQACALQSHVDLSAQPSSTALGRLFEKWKRAKPTVTEFRLRRDPHLPETTLALVFEIEEQTAQCGTPTGADLALLTIARQRSRENQ